jgi:hypothetical protein
MSWYPNYGKIDMVGPPPGQSSGSFNPFSIHKLSDSSGPMFDQPVPPNPSAFDAYADTPVANGGTPLSSVTDLIIDPFNPSAALGDGSVVFVVDPIKPLFAFTSPDLL